MDDLVDYALQHAMDLGARYAEVRQIENQGREILLRNGNLDVTGFINSCGLSVRILKNGFGFASTDLAEKEEVKNCVEKAFKSAKGQKHTIEIDECKGEEYNEIIKGEDSTDTIKILGDFDSKIRGYCPVRLFELMNYYEDKYYVNSDGAKIHTMMPRTHLFSLITVGEQNLGFEQFTNDFGGVGNPKLLENWNFENVIEDQAKQVLKSLKEKNKPPKGRIDYILGPRVSGLAAHESCGHPYEADRIWGREMAQAGGSFLKGDEIGERIGSDAASVIDDPTIKGSYGYYKYDDEGVKAKKRYLIKNGMINEFLQNRETAVIFKTRSNGSARASEYDKEPIVRMANTYIEPGDYTKEELIEEIKLGVLMESFMEWNIDDKRLNQKYTASEAYLIENGEVRKTLYRPKIEVTTQQFYSSIDACSKDLEFTSASCGKGEPMQPMPVFVGGPYVRVREVIHG